ncbi:ribose 5-phosphate isomerase B [Candidatus Peregrinibacteria bacterium RIFOXYC2_FULL_33_13]|nr:MAG: Ribose 5-phosphate isomerase B [Candidatus Peregrinibacteria bacterium GW2011_GWA2_33_10]KKP40873.1 MAG: ribose-5-phosphate isomerase, ribose 5-phosphate isomerase B [Candidatus Peregrinibacteria bacterium GW2011_GWC2_33_13]OGJ50760.1 MAG: ribose 5-phosphate isomerase B [Candidatus Peregrinibacteria bacterium RIFOXYA2_FULL_33_7]OGJ54844.1 MAG: ribose 5-phosphate isomerase B [Candidatus Peregrinibacteria bacterium RIFOXYC2_FULL_33_13]
MILYLGSDHRGYELKQKIKKWMDEKKIDYTDLGSFSTKSVDYPDIAREVSEKVHETKEFGILICASGQGMAMSANKAIDGVRAALCNNKEMAIRARQHNNANVCTLGSEFINEKQAIEIIDAFLTTDFEGGRHEIRVQKMGKKV